MKRKILQYFLTLLILFIAGCATFSSPPVIERSPAKKPPPAVKNNTEIKESNQEKDWRPDTYVVKKGDTLFAIGLEFGYDYKDIAQANNLSAPYTIKIGQQLKLQSLKSKPTSNIEGAVTTPLKAESNPQISNEASSITISEPKAIREPYSEQALNSTSINKTNTDKVNNKTEPNKTDNTKAETKSASETKPLPEAKPVTESKTNTEDIDWAWPTSGKIIAGFNDSNNAKGIDIAGTQGQAIKAAASGKVIYSGADLRGYGKLVIVKHSNNYLSVYAHNSQIIVKEGQQVSQGQKIAEMGNTDADRVKLHFEIRKQGKSVDPEKYLTENAK